MTTPVSLSPRPNFPLTHCLREAFCSPHDRTEPNCSPFCEWEVGEPDGKRVLKSLLFLIFIRYSAPFLCRVVSYRQRVTLSSLPLFFSPLLTLLFLEVGSEKKKRLIIMTTITMTWPTRFYRLNVILERY